jgi:hypothetical protein
LLQRFFSNGVQLIGLDPHWNRKGGNVCEKPTVSGLLMPAGFILARLICYEIVTVHGGKAGNWKKCRESLQASVSAKTTNTPSH